MTEIKINLDDYGPEIAARILTALSDALVDGGQKPRLTAVRSEEEKTTPVETGTQPDDAAAEEQTVSLETVREAMHQYAQAHGKAAAKAVLTEHGIGKLTDADEKTLAAIYKVVGVHG